MAKDKNRDECAVADEKEAAARRFARDVIKRGEAGRPDESGQLGPGQTHERLPDKDGELQVKRRRFSVS